MTPYASNTTLISENVVSNGRVPTSGKDGYFPDYPNGYKTLFGTYRGPLKWFNIVWFVIGHSIFVYGILAYPWRENIPLMILGK